MKFQKKWSDKDLQKLRELAATGKSFLQIGKILGYSRNACAGKAHREKITKAPADTTPRPKRIIPQKISKVLKPSPLPPEKKALNMLLIPMMELTRQNCRYPIGENENILFCGLPRQPNRSYCKEHAETCYKPLVSIQDLKKRRL